MKVVTFKEFTYEIPFKISCTVSGQVKTYTLEAYINKKIDKFLTLENLLATYVCKDAKKLLKEGMSVEDIIARLNEGFLPKNVAPKEDPIEVVIEDISEDLLASIEYIGEVEEPFIEMLDVPESELPFAKLDAKGNYRNPKGHLISKANLINYQIAS